MEAGDGGLGFRGQSEGSGDQGARVDCVVWMRLGGSPFVGGVGAIVVF